MNRNAANGDSQQRIARSDWSADSRPSETVVETVAAATDCDPLELDSLQSYVDVDALDALLRSADADDVHVSFDYADVGVFVASSGTVELYGDPADVQ